jgi:excinuclease ABC subunit A
VTLSGGEAQRIRLATQVGSRLVGVLYVLDEPSIGLHPRDNARLLETLKGLRDLGNTVLVVEHDDETIREADWVIDLGPAAGEHGGQVMAEGTPKQILVHPKSLTGQYLSGRKQVAVPKKRREGNGKSLTIVNATANNLKVTRPDSAWEIGLYHWRLRVGKVHVDERHHVQRAGRKVDGRAHAGWRTRTH